MLDVALIPTGAPQVEGRLVHAPSVPTCLYTSSSPSRMPHNRHAHTHIFFLAAISNIHSPILFNWNKSTGSHGWITGSIKNMPVKKCQDPCSKGTVVLYQLYSLIDCLTDCVNGSKAGGLGVTLYNIPYGSRWAAKWVMFFMPPAPSHSDPLDSSP